MRHTLQAYSNNLIDHHMILDLLPLLAQAYFAGAIPVSISYGQAAILLALGLQHVDVDTVAQSLGLPVNQVLALFNKLVRRLQGRLQAAQEAEAARSLPTRAPVVLGDAGEDVGLDEELEQGAAVRVRGGSLCFAHNKQGGNLHCASIAAAHTHALRFRRSRRRWRRCSSRRRCSSMW